MNIAGELSAHAAYVQRFLNVRHQVVDVKSLQLHHYVVSSLVHVILRLCGERATLGELERHTSVGSLAREVNARHLEMQIVQIPLRVTHLVPVAQCSASEFYIIYAYRPWLFILVVLVVLLVAAQFGQVGEVECRVVLHKSHLWRVECHISNVHFLSQQFERIDCYLERVYAHEIRLVVLLLHAQSFSLQRASEEVYRQIIHRDLSANPFLTVLLYHIFGNRRYENRDQQQQSQYHAKNNRGYLQAFLYTFFHIDYFDNFIFL